MKDRTPLGGQSGWVAPLLLFLLAIAVVGGPILMHFAQMKHNQLATIDEVIPRGEKAAPGELFATTLIAIVEHELKGTTGWRPNDFILWGPRLTADNNASRQLGIIRAVRESTRVFKDHLTKISSNEYDPNLVQADNAFRNDETKFWFPSAESKLTLGVRHLNAYIAGLKTDPPTSRPVSQRNVELIRLFQAWTDLLGGSHAELYSNNIPWLSVDDAFYQAQGVAHVLYHLTLAVDREYASDIETRPALHALVQEVTVPLHEAATLKPLIVMNGSNLLANHRRNLDAYVNEARQKMYSIREELEK